MAGGEKKTQPQRDDGSNRPLLEPRHHLRHEAPLDVRQDLPADLAHDEEGEGAAQRRHDQREEPPPDVAPAQHAGDDEDHRGEVQEFGEAEPEDVQRDAEVSSLIDRAVDLLRGEGFICGGCLGV